MEGGGPRRKRRTQEHPAVIREVKRVLKITQTNFIQSEKHLKHVFTEGMSKQYGAKLEKVIFM